MNPEPWLEFFKYSPAIMSLMGVIILMYRLLVKRDDIINALVAKTKEDVERQAKLIALLEVLVQKGGDR